jgi:hypothetical protein
MGDGFREDTRDVQSHDCTRSNYHSKKWNFELIGSLEFYSDDEIDIREEYRDAVKLNQNKI